MSTPELSSSRPTVSTWRTCNHKLTFSLLAASEEPDSSKNLRLERTPHPWWSRFPTLGRYVDRESARRIGTTARSRRSSPRSGSTALPWRILLLLVLGYRNVPVRLSQTGAKDPMSGVQSGL